MTCHDTQIDRRILHQAQSLTAEGHHVTIMAFSPNEHTYTENISSRLVVFRIGFNDLRLKNLPFSLDRINFFKIREKQILKYYKGICLVAACLFKPLSQKKFQNLYLQVWLPFTKPFVFFGRQFEFDLIQCHDFPTLEAAVKLAKEKKVNLIYDSHELYPEQYTFSKYSKLIYKESEHRLIKFCKLVFTVNQSIAKKMADYYQIDEPITLINALDAPENFNVNQRYDLLREDLNIPLSKKVLLFQGGFSAHRQLENLIESFVYVKNHDVVLVMMGSGDIKDVLQQKAADFGLLNRKVYFHDPVPQDELIFYSASADMGIIPYPHIDLNSYYCTPNKLFEFIQAHLPMIANDSPELRRFIVDQNFGMVHLMNSALSIAEAINIAFEKLETSDWKLNLKQKSQMFSWHKISQIYLNAMKPFLTHKTKEEKACAG